MHTTLLTAHPVSGSFCSSLAAAWQRGAERAGATVHHFDATALHFDPVLRSPSTTREDDEPDLARVRDAVERSAHVCILFPVWWVGLPAAMKGLVDRLLLPDWSFRYDGKSMPTGLLAGRSARYVMTMDSPRAWYWLWQGDALAGSFGRGTLRYVGFKPVERTVLHGVRAMDDAKRADWIRTLEQLGQRDVERARAAAPARPVTLGT